MYSGGVAGYTFRALRQNAARVGCPETVVVLGLAHQHSFSGVALMDGDAVETPLGEIELDREAAAGLAEGRPRVRFNYEPHAGEHSAENQIPFVQVSLPDTRLVVGLLGDHEPATVAQLGEGLTALAERKRVVVVASTDLLHDPDYELVGRTDRATLARIAAMDSSGVQQSWRHSRQICCGVGPVLALMHFAAARGCTEGTVLHYRNSGDDFPESRGQWVVGYGAVVFVVTDND